jgi:hypothetical protein
MEFMMLLSITAKDLRENYSNLFPPLLYDSTIFLYFYITKGTYVFLISNL